MLTLWSAFFAYLWMSDEMVRFLGPRTYWVVPFGCLTLGRGGTCALRNALAGTEDGERITGGMSRSDLVGIAVLLVPIVAVIARPGGRARRTGSVAKGDGSAEPRPRSSLHLPRMRAGRQASSTCTTRTIPTSTRRHSGSGRARR